MQWTAAKKTLALSGSVLALGGAVQFVQPAVPEAQAQSCSAVRILAAQGTGGTSQNKSVTDMPNFAEGKIALEMAKRFPGQVSYWNTPYPSSAGALHSAGAKNGETTTYGTSRLMGAKAMVKEMERYKAQCPSTKYLLTGFSQGAHVAGDAAALIGHNASSTVKADDLMGALLYSDPGRSGNSSHTGTTGAKGYMPLPPGAQYQRNGAYSNAGQADGAVGWTGQRSLDFKGLEGKVISLCNPTDLACSIQDKTFLRDVSDVSDKNYKPVPESYNNRVGIKRMLDSGRLIPVFAKLLSHDPVGKATRGEITALVDAFEASVKATPSLNQQERDTLDNAITEVRYIMKLLRSDKAYGGDIPESVIFAHVMKSAGKDAVANIPKGMIPDEMRPVADVLVKGLTNKDTSSIPQDVAKRMETALRYAVNFPAQHMEYYGADGKVRVGNQSAEDWALSAVEQGIRNVISGTMISYPAGSNPRSPGSAVERSDDKRLPDGLEAIAIPGWKDTVNFDPREYLKDSVDPGDVSEGDGSGAGSDSGDTTTPEDTTPETTQRTSNTPTSLPSTTSAKESDDDDKTSSTTSTTTGTFSTVSPVSSPGKVSGPQVNTGGVATGTSVFAKVMALFK